MNEQVCALWVGWGGGEVSGPGETAAAPRLSLVTHQCPPLLPRYEVSCNALPRVPLFVLPHNRMHLRVIILESLVQLYNRSVGSGASHSQGRVRQSTLHLCHLTLQLQNCCKEAACHLTLPCWMHVCGGAA